MVEERGAAGSTGSTVRFSTFLPGEQNRILVLIGVLLGHPVGFNLINCSIWAYFVVLRNAECQHNRQAECVINMNSYVT